MFRDLPVRSGSFGSDARPLRWGLFAVLAFGAVAQAGTFVPYSTLTDLGTLPGDCSSFANALNDRGEVVGSSVGAGLGGRAFLYSDGKMIDLGAPAGSSVQIDSAAALQNLNTGAHSGTAYGINAGDQIAGQLDSDVPLL